MKRILMLVFMLLLMLTAFSALADEPVHTVLMIYMTGSDLESASRGGAGSRDIEEMMAALPPDGDTRVVLLTGGALSWKRPEIPWDENVLWEVTSEGLTRLSATGPENMGDPDTLSAFLREAAGLFPADRYALILWDHGGGPNLGVCFDERAGGDGLSLPELKEALEASPFAHHPLMFIGLDACLMATVETACILSPYAECMIASQEPEPGDGWNYAFLSSLTGEITAEEIGRIIVDSYLRYYADSNDYLTLSCVDLQLAPVLQEAVNRMFSAVCQEISPAEYVRSAEVRSNTKTLGNNGVPEWDLIDFGDFLNEMEGAGICDATEARDILNRMVLCRKENEEFISGLSIYCPFENKTAYTHPWASVYRSIPFSETYQSWVTNMSQIWLGTPVSSWREDHPIRAEASARKTHISAELDPEERSHLTGARLLVLEEIEEGEYRLIWSTEEVNPSENGILASYSGEALYALDAEGRILAGPITWRNLENGLAIGALTETPEHMSEPVYLICFPGENGEYTVSRVDTYSESVGMFTPSPMQLQAGDQLTFVSWCRTIPETGDVYEKWPYGSMTAVESVTVPENGFILKMLPLNASSRCCAVFELRDTQANIHLTNPILLEDRTSINLLDRAASLEREGIRVTLTDMHLSSGAEKEIRMTLQVKNESEQVLSAEAASLALDRSVFADMRTLPQDDLAPAGETDWELVIPEGMLRDARIREAEELSLMLKITKADGSVSFPAFSFPIGVSFAILDIGDPSGFDFVAETAADGLYGRILRIGLENGTVRGLMRLENRTDTPMILTGSEVWLNEREVYGSCCAGRMPVVIPSGMEAFCSFTVYPNDPVTNEPVDQINDIPDLHVLSWRFRGPADIRITWSLGE